MKNQVVSFHYTLKNKGGEVLDSSADSHPLSYLSGMGQIIPGLEEQLDGLAVGTKKKVAVPAAKAYGERNDKLILTVPRSRLPNTKLEIGDRFRGGEDAHAPIFTVTKLTETDATLDGNHPLAGEELFFDVEITGVREATAEEIKQGEAAHTCCGRHDQCEH